MANTNFKVFNEANTEANTYNDSEYTNATQRLNGVIPGMAISRMHNKMFRQWSVMAAAIGQYIASSGYNCVDNDLAGIVDALGKVTGVNIRKDSTAYSLGSVAFCGNLTSGLYLECTTAGTTASSIPTAMTSAAENDTVTDGTVTWTVRKMASTEDIKKYTGGTRQKSTAYALGDCAGLASLPAEWFLECTTAGTTTASDLVISSPTVGATVTDGSVVWTIRKTASTAELANYLSLVGGHLTGNSPIIDQDNDTGAILLMSGENGTSQGAYIQLNGPNRATNPGYFTILANDGNVYKILQGKPDGTLTWNGSNILTDANGGYLPLVGGALTGAKVTRNTDDDAMVFFGGKGEKATGFGADIQLCGPNHATRAGEFIIWAEKLGQDTELRGTPAGALTWGSNDLAGSAIVAKSLGATGYIKYASGLVMQWGTATNLPASQDVVPVTFPITFPNGVGSVVITSAGSYGNQLGFSWGQVKDITTSGFKLSTAASDVDSQGKNWFAIGY